jgi:tryptophan synthase alpha chain
MTTDRITQKFARLKSQQRTGLFLFLTAGFPDLKATQELIPALVEAGADGIEVGVPFSDPLADGATIQASSFHALQQGVTLQDCLDLVASLRAQIPETPLILMGYYNPIFAMGLDAFCDRAQEAGVDGLIVPDLPTEESGPLLGRSRARGIHLIPLLAPTSTDQRIEKVCAEASGFIYCVSVTGVTGVRDSFQGEVGTLVDTVRRHTSLPIGVGFGISQREHMETVGRVADAAIVGSALIRTIQEAPRDEMKSRAVAFVKGLRAAPIVASGEAH